jgi:23S rRNA (cytosine1962-C5)-methyltransferase
MKRIILKRGEEHRVALGHPWVYDNEIETVLDGKAQPAKPAGGGSPLEAGELADVESSRKEYLGRAYVNPASKIRARIYSPSKEGLDRGFFKRRLREALLRRVAGFAGGTGAAKTAHNARTESMRILFGEADFLPGLVIDRYVGWPRAEAEARISERPLTFAALETALGPPESWLAVQFLAFGVDCRREEILAAVDEVCLSPLAAAGRAAGVLLGRPAGIVEKSTAPVRELEGLPPREGVIAGSVPEGGIVIFENGLPFAVDLAEGQKTGHFLDQKENRLRAAACAEGDVLDAFCYSGGFAIHAARYGGGAGGDDAARKPLRITAVDTSRAALDMARRNAALNGVADHINTVEADVFDYLRAAEQRKETYDLIILDPPAFAKSKAVLSNALRGYREINSAALKLLKSGGVLVSCSCSQAVGPERFAQMIADSAADADRRLVQLDFRFQAADHPVRVGYGESLYLKCGFYRAL